MQNEKKYFTLFVLLLAMGSIVYLNTQMTLTTGI